MKIAIVSTYLANLLPLELDIHDIATISENEILFINTRFSCLATIKKGYSFAPVWKPPFITQLYPEDRCHLNGLAIQDNKAAYVTACSTTNEATGWRNHRTNGGVVIHVPTSEIIMTGLSMPHSPRWYNDKLWLLNSGAGEFGYVDNKKFVPITFCPGFLRGLAFWKNYALIGLSKLRSKAFTGLLLENRLEEVKLTSQCGLTIIDINTGKIEHALNIEGVVEELFDVVVLPGIKRPSALGFHNDDIERMIAFPGAAGMIITHPKVDKNAQSNLRRIIQPGLPKI